MKLYAIRNKETGKIVNDNYGHPHVRRCPEDVFDSRRDELVTLRIEPTEPCDKCKSRWYGEFNYKDENSNDDWKTLMANEWKCCPNCGRSLE